MTNGGIQTGRDEARDCTENHLLHESVYVAGSGRNGSTFLGLQLERSPDICFAGELTHLWERGWKENQLCGCGAEFRQCEFWGEVLREGFPKILESDVDEIIRLRRRVSSLKGLVPLRVRQQSVDSKTVTDYGRVYQSLIDAIAKISGRSIVLDSSKYPTDLAALLRVRPELKTIHLIRDCRAVVYSWRRRKQRTEIHWKNQLMPRYGALKTALAWKNFNAVIESLTKALPANRQIIHYENTVSDLQKELLAITDWLECRPVSNAASVGVGHSVSGNPCRFKFDHADVQADKEWETEMSRIDRWIVKLLCHDSQKRYGY